MKPHSLSNNRPIGIFDSGLGGLTVLKALEKSFQTNHLFTLVILHTCRTVQKAQIQS